MPPCITAPDTTTPPVSQTSQHSLSCEKIVEKLRTCKPVEPDDIGPRVLKAVWSTPAPPLQPEPAPSESPTAWDPVALNDCRPVALISGIMNVMERLILRHLRWLVSKSHEPLRFAYQPHLGQMMQLYICCMLGVYSSCIDPTPQFVNWTLTCQVPLRRFSLLSVGDEGGGYMFLFLCFIL